MSNIQLRPYQQQFINDVRNSFKVSNKCLAVLPCGAGKTVCFAYMAEQHIKKYPNGCVWFLVHRKELMDQTIATFKRFGIDTSDKIKIGMVQTMANKIKKNKPLDSPTLIIQDECFPANTKILTNNGYRNICDIKENDIVLSYNESTKNIDYKPVTKIFKNYNKKLVKIKLQNGKYIICTTNHPIYTQRGYIKAENLRSDDYAMCYMWKRSRFRYFKQRNKKTFNRKRLLLLLKRMSTQKIKYNNEKYKSINERCIISKNERKQSNVQYKNKKESVPYFKRNRTSPYCTRWQWKRINSSSRKIIYCFKRTNRFNSSNRICSTNENEKTFRLSNMLQNRYCNSRNQISNRSRWWITPYIRKESSRQKENRIFKWIRVECIEIQESRSYEQFRKLYQDHYVYNLEVKDNHNYFVYPGILVHNCHHASSNTYLTITNKYPNVPLIGLTATPCRLDGKSLGNIFKSLIIGVESDFLINNGYLCHYKYFAPRIAQNEPKIKGSDYDVDSILYEHKIYGDVEKYIDPNKKTIIYCPNIEFSKQLCERINNNLNINAVHFDGNTPKKLRDQIVSDFRNNKIKILSNVDLIGEGFDVPDCDCVIMLRPTMSVALYIQQAMRCLRPAPNKLATIYDFVGNVFRHGMPTEHREWTLDKQIKCRNPSSSPDVLVRECKNCFRVYRGNGRICPYCGYDNGKTQKQIEEDKKAELQEIQNFIKKSNRMQVGMAKTKAELQQIANERGYNKKWVYVQCKIKGIPY